MTEERYLKFDIAERFIHWCMALSIIALIITGLNIRYPGLIFGMTMNTARLIHFVSMYVLIFAWIAHVYHTLVIERAEEITGVKDLKALPAMLKYYLFISDEHPLYTRYNPLQKIAYNLMWVFIFIMIITGLPMYWPDKLMWLTEMLGGIMALRILHDFMTYIFITYLLFHVYMVVTEDIRSLWSMFHGYYYRRVGPEE
jgi:Ni/Fe-hydrogenase 1 B-type cytochrome subunit